MHIITDNAPVAETLMGQQNWSEVPSLHSGNPLKALTRALFGEASLSYAEGPEDSPWRLLLISAEAPQSQYDALIELCRDGVDLPDGLACLAARGAGFHGFKGRPWSSPPGNIYLCAHFAPDCPVHNFGPGFMALAAVSTAEAIDSLAGLEDRAMIKWVNDILINEAKVGGVLAHTSTQGDSVTSAILGIGLNVFSAPAVTPTPFVPQVTSLGSCQHASEAPSLLTSSVSNLLGTLADNYRLLLNDGDAPLVRKYHGRSMVLGRDVAICLDTADDCVEVVAEGHVAGITERLELRLEGRAEPIASGRLMLK